MKFLNRIIDNSRTTLSLFAIVVIAGIYSYKHMPVESTPEVAIPYISILVSLDGISPEDGVRLLIRPSEVELRNISGVREMTARALENYVNIVVEFDGNINVDSALNDVRAAMTRAQAHFPDSAEEPVIRELTSDEYPVLAIGLISEGATERTLYNYAHDLRRKIQTLPDVLRVEVMGAREEVLEIIIDSTELQNHNIQSRDLINAVSQNNLLIPAGEIDTGKGRFSIKLPGLIESHYDLYTLPVKSTSDTVVKLSDIATIRRTFKDANTITLVNGKQAMSIDVSKRTGSNMINVANSVKELMEAEKASVPGGVKVMTVFDMSPFALQMVKELEGNILAAVALVLIVLVASLGLRSSFLVSMGMPISTLGGLTVLYLLGYSFNFMVLFGLLLALGMIVDGAIVIGEYADRKMAEGLEPRDAYVAASVRMFVPVTVSLLTTLAAFLPLIFWPGIDGQFMRILPITVFSILSCSWLYALVVLPVLGSLFGKKPAMDATSQRLQQLEHGDPLMLGGITGAYARLIEKVLKQSVLSFLIMMLMLIGIFGLYIFSPLNAGTKYFTDSDGIHGEVNVNARGNLSIEESAVLVREVEEIVRNTPYVHLVYTTAYPVGMAQGRRGAAEDEIGHMLVELVDPNERSRSSKEIFWEIRERTQHLAGIQVQTEELSGGPPVLGDIQLEMTSDNLELLNAETVRVREYLKNHISGLVDVTDTLPLPGIEWELRVDRAQAALYGVNVAEAGQVVQLLTNGILMGTYRPDHAEEEVDIRIRYPLEQRNAKALDDLMVNTEFGAVPISNFVTRSARPRVNKLQRMNGTNVASVFANAAIGVLPNDKIAEIQHWLDTEANIDEQINYRFRGARENQEESARFLAVAMGLALLLMLTLLVAQFNSFYQAFLVLSSVVLSTAGVLLGHMLFQQTFSIVLGGVGIVALAGVIVQNNIILLDTYNTLRREQPNMNLVDLAVRTGAQRLRPVLLTAITAGLGLIPLALGVSVDLIGRDITMRGQVAGYWKPLAASLVYGLSFATILTLILTPMLMVVPQRLSIWWKIRKA